MTEELSDIESERRWRRRYETRKRIAAIFHEIKLVAVYFTPTALFYACGVMFPWTIGPNFMTSLSDAPTWASCVFGSLALISFMIILSRIKGGSIGFTEGGIWRRSYVTYLPVRTYSLIQFPLAFIPVSIMMIDRALSWSLLNPACATQSTRDYFLLSLDALAKGAVIDLFESFHVDVFACGPNKDSVVASLIVFAVRSFSTYVMVYSVVRVFLRHAQLTEAAARRAQTDPVRAGL